MAKRSSVKASSVRALCILTSRLMLSATVFALAFSAKKVDLKFYSECL